MRHGMWWNLKEGQLKEEEEVHDGYRNRRAAKKSANEYRAAGQLVEVRLLTTVEHDLPADDPLFKPEQAFESKRWCPVIIPCKNPVTLVLA